MFSYMHYLHKADLLHRSNGPSSNWQQNVESSGKLVRNVTVTLGPDILMPCVSVSVAVKGCAAE